MSRLLHSRDVLKSAQHSVRRPVRRRAACALLVAMAAASLQAERHGGAVPREANAAPTASIPVGPLGFISPGANLLMQRVAGTTLNFIDGNRLLFTFRKAGLLRRAADARPDDDDQLIHAEIVNIATRQVESSADWRMHDRGQFLWPLGRGNFVVRERDTLYRTDASLELTPYARFPGRLLSVQLSPDHRVMVAVSEEARAKAASASSAPTLASPASIVQSGVKPGAQSGSNATPDAGDDSDQNVLPLVVRILNIETNSLIGQTRTRMVPRVPTIETGFLEALSGKGDQWTVVLKGFDDHDRSIAKIDSGCSPTLQFLNTSVVLISTCDRSDRSKDHLLTAVTLDGKPLWDRRTEGRHIWPAYAYAEDGSRFALETLVLNHPVSAMDPFEPEDILGQLVEVFDTHGGESKLVAPASPVLDSGQNFALSADGQKFAILHNDAIEIYDLK